MYLQENALDDHTVKFVVAASNSSGGYAFTRKYF